MAALTSEKKSQMNIKTYWPKGTSMSGCYPPSCRDGQFKLKYLRASTLRLEFKDRKLRLNTTLTGHESGSDILTKSNYPENRNRITRSPSQESGHNTG